MEVVPRDALLAAALRLAGEIAAKDGYLLRLAKAAINGIDPVDVHRSYRFEQGFTFEASLSGVAERLRDTFGNGAPCPEGRSDAEGTNAPSEESS
ncbi:Enoyl-CoA hydratase family protein OS=Streptomyces rimosus subsp. rimosus (strain ATCC / DSM 40260 / JCM 4667 / NRRL 2234) OX=1265868 GN=SRIM_034470 PE=4 SV=1 [Streptomyces rimosus subsp. rimosus]